MKYEVIRRFRDKHTRKIILPGAAFICDERDRIKDLIDRGIIKKQELDPGTITKKELMEMLEDKGIGYNSKQTKAELAQLLQGGD